MRREWLLAVALLLSSMFIGWMAWGRGEIGLYLFLIFPVLKADGAYGVASLLMAFAAMVVTFFAFLTRGTPEDGRTERSTSVGGVIMIGPIPLVLGSDRRTTVVTLVLALIVLMIVILLLVQ